MSDFREMRRKRQQLSEEESIGILQKATAGTLALLGDNGYPYAVPISYVYADGKLYFHSALSGHKVDAIRNCDKASFCVIDKDDVADFVGNAALLHFFHVFLSISVLCGITYVDSELRLTVAWEKHK